MKFICTRENFLRGLNAVVHIASRNTSLPILSNVFLEASAKGLTLITTNLEIGITTKIRGKVEQPGKLTVNARLLADVVQLAPSEQIHVSSGENILTIDAGETKSKIRGIAAEDFPILPNIERATRYKVSCASFRTASQQVSFAAAQDETRPELSGVLFQFDRERLTIAATDSYRLAEKTIPLSEQTEARQLIIPNRSVNEALRILEGQDGDLVITVSDNQALFQIKETELISRTIEGTYPDYTQIIPKDRQTFSTASVSALTTAVRAANLFCKPTSHDITLLFDPKKGEIVVSATNPNLGEHIGRVPAKVEGTPNTIVFNARYILDGLGNLEGASATLALNNETNPGVLRAEGQDDYLYLIMPIRQ